MSRELLQQALDALIYHTNQTRPIERTDTAITALRAALAQPEPEPVAWQVNVQTPSGPIVYGVYDNAKPGESLKTACKDVDIVVVNVPLYATPQAIDGFGGNLDSAFEPASAPVVPDLAHKPTVQLLMDLARRFRATPGDLYDGAYKELERACYEALSAAPAVPTVLELAAKAVGYRVVSRWEWEGLNVDVGGGATIVKWNPLTDDGDALRLAVQLNLCIAVNYGTVVVDIPHVINSIVEKHNGDPYPATRRAIVRAAAEIGRAE